MLQSTLAAIAAGRIAPIYLVHGDRVLAEPAGLRLAEALAKQFDCEPGVVRRPDELAGVVADLRTFSLFGSGKVVVAVESGLLADKSAAGALFDDVRSQLPWSGEAADLQGKSRDAALRLLQILRLFDVDPAAVGVDRALAALPATVFAGKSGRAGKNRSADETRDELAPLLRAALDAGLRGVGEGDVSLVADLLRDGLPDRHALVLVESALAEKHPVVEALERREAVVEAGEVTVERGKFSGLAPLAAELEQETGVAIERPALELLAQRTLKSADRRRGGPEGAIAPDSTERFAGEYRKLAALAGAGGRIGAGLVRDNIEDRGEEDVWAILDAIGAGRGGEALSRLGRKLAGADDPMQERLAFFGLLAALCRQLVAVRGMVALAGVPGSVRDYAKFKSQWAPRLQGKEVAGLSRNPLAGLHPFRLHRAYLTAMRLPVPVIDRLPALVLETERRLKGDSGEPDAALAELVLAVAQPSAGVRRVPA